MQRHDEDLDILASDTLPRPIPSPSPSSSAPPPPVRAPDPSPPLPPSTAPAGAYRCRFCSAALFPADSRVTHGGPSVPGTAPASAETQSGRKPFQKKGARDQGGPKDCTSVFLEGPPEWMGEPSEADGDVACRKCGRRVGGWNWAGAQCSCGLWVSPAFQFQLSKVEYRF